MDSAIPQHLKCPRTQVSRQPQDHAPAYPAWCARLGDQKKPVVFANFGVQWKDAGDESAARDYVQALAQEIEGPSGADHFDIAHYRDEAGYDTLVVLSYWLDPQSYDQWRAGSEAANARATAAGSIGTFEEILTPNLAQVETLYSAPEAVAGIGKTSNVLSDEIVEHAYWGSARDRLPVSQTDALEPEGKIEVVRSEEDGRHITLKGHDNIAIIRSGQDWSDTGGEERKLYLGRIAPPLHAGMEFLRDEGAAIGCYFNRFMQLVDMAGTPQEKTFGWSYWRSLADMETWADSHPSHLAIFDTFNDVVVELNFELDLKLSHEIYVVRASEQTYSYHNCHGDTGFLKQALSS